MGTSPFRFFLFVTKPHRIPAIGAIIAVIVAGVLSSIVPYIFKLIANAAAALSQGGSYTTLLYAGEAYIVVVFLAKASWRTSGFFGAQWATGVRATARHSLTAYVTLHSRSYFSDRFAGSLANKISHAGNGARDLVEKFLWEFLELGVSVVASFILAFTVSPRIALIFLAWVVLLTILNVYFARARVPLSAATQKLETALNGATVDLLSNITAMQEYARRIFEIDRLKAAIERRRVEGLRNWYYGERILILNGVLQLFFGGAMILMAVHFARTGAVSPGDVILVLAIIFRVDGLLQSLGSNLNSFTEVWGEIGESLEEIVEPHEIPDKPDAKDITISGGAIDFKKITFAYGQTLIFDHLSLSIPAGERVGLVGRSGAGKSTFMRILLHHYEVHSGVVCIDGTDIAGVTQESLRRAISVVPQEPLLFHRSIRENIAYGNPEASDEEVFEAARLAQAHEFIERLSGGYEALVGERGVKLSGGERQRIAIARAILKDAPILLLDEATAALDSESEVAIQKALHELMQGKTVIAIAHRLSTLREMDRLLVMDGGKIVEEGTHAQLLLKKGKYAELWNHQAGGFIQDE